MNSEEIDCLIGNIRLEIDAKTRIKDEKDMNKVEIDTMMANEFLQGFYMGLALQALVQLNNSMNIPE